MKNKLILYVFFLVFLLIETSCDKSNCKNTNVIFDKYSPETEVYKKELVEELSKIDKSKLTYWLDAYQEKNGLKYIQVSIQGDTLCAKIILVIKNSKKGIEEIIKNKGVGYVGAELKNLEFLTYLDYIKTEFIFKKISRIVD
ncbi:hypothetical protein OX283_006630 [Flavobacterium sp. SUN052]|uniref:hypothetical protein n=1 Tax=Flavobacterium sp. SUN052 TaxID=3002441 RepID=UPI00237E99CD|nr:hypothetical protein [Flavobacterium sp. SUN052]MEC4004324.1 hypothetical protein [Flavobacterium sp. SUN052]